MLRVTGWSGMALCLLLIVVILPGCFQNSTSKQPGGVPTGVGTPPNPGGGGGSSPIKEIMAKLTKGPNSLTPVIGKELGEEQPPWETIQPQTQEYAKLASEMGGFTPPKGSPESWAKLAGAYAASAKALEQAAMAKDKKEASQPMRT